ncbi:MAG: protein kinase [Anaeromyxobacteraceae bacterium]
MRVAGRGGLADVHLARERASGRMVALKLFRPGPRLRALVSEEALRAEADAGARVEHPNVVGYFDAGTWAGGPFVVSDWLDGRTLQERLRERPLPEAEVLAFSRQIAAALEAAHASGIAHRDLEPGNVLLLPDGRVKVTGLGLSRPSGRNLSAGGAPPFLAPEQWRGEPGDARSDVFALGVIMFQALTGNIPYAVAGSHTDALERGATPRPVGVHWELADVISRCLHRDPRRRFRDGAEVAHALAAYERGGRLPRPARRAVAVAAAVAAVAAIVAGGLWVRGRGGEATLPVIVLDEVDTTRTEAFAGVAELLARALEPSGRVRAMPKGDLAGAARAGGTGRLDVAAVKPAWDDLKARWALELTLRRLSAGYVGELTALNPRTGDRAFTVAERCADLSDAVEMIDRLARRARLALGEPPAEVDGRPARLAASYTPDLEAWRWYQAGTACLAAPRAPERPCDGPFREAVAKDPGFGAAQLALALLSLEAGADVEGQRAALAPVTAAGARLPERAAALAAAWRSALAGDDRAATAAYERLMEGDLGDRDAPLLAADLAWQRGRLEDAATLLERAQRASPADPWVQARLARVLGHLADRRRLESLAGALAAGGRTPGALHVLSLTRGWLGDARAAAAAADTGRKAGSPLAADDLVHALASSGDLRGRRTRRARRARRRAARPPPLAARPPRRDARRAGALEGGAEGARRGARRGRGRRRVGPRPPGGAPRRQARRGPAPQGARRARAARAGPRRRVRRPPRPGRRPRRRGPAGGATPRGLGPGEAPRRRGGVARRRRGRGRLGAARSREGTPEGPRRAGRGGAVPPRLRAGGRRRPQGRDGRAPRRAGALRARRHPALGAAPQPAPARDGPGRRRPARRSGRGARPAPGDPPEGGPRRRPAARRADPAGAVRGAEVARVPRGGDAHSPKVDDAPRGIASPTRPDLCGASPLCDGP